MQYIPHAWYNHDKDTKIKIKQSMPQIKSPKYGCDNAYSVHQRRRSMRTPAADSLEVIILPKGPRWDLERRTAVIDVATARLRELGCSCEILGPRGRDLAIRAVRRQR